MAKKARKSKKTPELIREEKITKVRKALCDMHTLMGLRPKDGESVTINRTPVEPGLDIPDLPEQLSKPEEHLGTDMLEVVLLGETGAGKTLLARVIADLKRDDDELLPENALTNTAWAVRLVSSKEPNPSVRVTSKDGTPTEISREEYLQEAALGRKSLKDWHLAEIEIESSLPTEIRLVDTPGLNASVSFKRALEDEELTHEVLKTAHAIVCVSGSRPPMRGTDVEAFRRQFGPRVHSSVKHLFFVLNEDVPLSDDTKQAVLSEVQGDLESESLFKTKSGEFDKDLYDSRVFYFNAKTVRTHQLSYRSVKVKEELTKHLEECGYLPFHKSLVNLSKESYQLQLDSIIRAVEPVYEKAVTDIEEQIRVAELNLDQINDEINKIVKDLPRLEASKKHAVINFTRWRAHVLQAATNEVNRWFINAFETEWDLHWSEAIGAPNRLRSRILQDRRSEVARDIRDRVVRHFEEKLETWVEDTLHQKLLNDLTASEDFTSTLHAFDLHFGNLTDTLKDAENLLSTAREDIFEAIRMPATELSSLISRAFDVSSRTAVRRAIADRFSRIWHWADEENTPRYFQRKVGEELSEEFDKVKVEITDAITKNIEAEFKEIVSQTVDKVEYLLETVVANRRAILQREQARRSQIDEKATSEIDRLKTIRDLIEKCFQDVRSGLSD